MLKRLGKVFGRNRPSRVRGLLSSRPIVLLQSDDWGRVGVRDQEGFELLRASGIGMGERAYDFYTLETAEDVIAVRDLLKRHHDSTGRSPCLVMNFVMANLDFGKMIGRTAGNEICLLPLSAGLPGKWSRPGLFEAYREGIREGVLYPALHGLTHFCRRSVEEELTRNGAHADLLRTVWHAETPYIYWRMPWVGFEYASTRPSRERFLAAEAQTALIQQAADHFTTMFSHPPISACAPGYRANRDTRAAWSKCGVRVAQNGVAARPPHLDEGEILNLHRTIDFEPSQGEVVLEDHLRALEDSFANGIPAVISVHAINFHSTVKDFRGPTLKALDVLLSALESRHPDLLYVHDSDLYDIVTQGRFMGEHGAVPVTIKHADVSIPRAAGAR